MDGSVLIASDLNAQNLQLLFILQEKQEMTNLFETFLSDAEAKSNFQENLTDFTNFLQYSPISFGRFYVDSNGDLILNYFGSLTSDNIAINTEGELVVSVEG